MRIPEEVLDDILSKISIVNLISQYIDVDTSGMNALVRCPFHDDKTPSLSVSDEKGLFYCHACGATGNAVQFLMKYKNVEFRDAVKELADLAGVDVSPWYGGKPSGNPVKGRKKVYFLRRLAENLAVLKNTTSSFVIATYLEDKNPSSRRQPWRENYYPGLDKTGSPKRGTPAEGLSTTSVSRLLRESKKQERMVSFCVSLMGEERHQSKSGYWNKRRTESNATHLLTVSLDFDNVEFKSKKGNREYLNLGNLADFLGETKERLYLRVKETLEKLELWEYAAVVDTGSGYHVHFILDRATPYSEIDAWQEPGRFDPGQAFDYLLRSLVLATRSDPALVKRSSMVKLLPGTPYTKITLPKERQPQVELKKDARGFLTTAQILAKLAHKSFEELDKEFAVYGKSFQLFARHGRLPEIEFLQALNSFYRTKPRGEDIEADFEKYIENGTLPATGGDAGEDYYNGRTEWEGGDGSAISITNKYLMKYRTKQKVRDPEGNIQWNDCWLTIPCGCALIPRYRIDNETDPEDFKFVFDCLKPGEKRTVTVDGRRFGCADSLQKALRALQVDITLSQKSASALYSYALKYAVPIRNVHVGVNYVYDDDEQITGSFLAGYDFAFKDGFLYRGKNGIIETGEEPLFIKGYDLRWPNEHRRRFGKKSPEPEGKVRELAEKINKIFTRKEVSQIYLSYLGMAMAREGILQHFAGVPFLSLHGESGCGKTTLLEVAREIFNQQLLTNKPTVSTTVKTQKHRRNGVMLFDELDENHLPHLLPFLKDSVTNAYRPRQDKEGRVIGDDQILNSIIVSTNLPLHYEGVPWDFRMAKIRFSKKLRKLNVSGLAELRAYSEKNGFDVYIDLYEKVSAIDFDKFAEETHRLEEKVLKHITKDARLAQMYAILLAMGYYIGLDIDFDEMMEFVKENEGDQGSATSIIVAQLAACAADLKPMGDNPPTDWPKTATGGEMYPGGAIVPQIFKVSLKRFTDYLKHNNVFHNIDQRGVGGMIHSLSFVRKQNTSLTQIIKGDKVYEHGMFLVVDLGDEAFREFFWQNIQIRKKKKIETYCRVRIDDREEEKPEEDPFLADSS